MSRFLFPPHSLPDFPQCLSRFRSQKRFPPRYLFPLCCPPRTLHPRFHLYSGLRPCLFLQRMTCCSRPKSLHFPVGKHCPRRSFRRHPPHYRLHQCPELPRHLPQKSFPPLFCPYPRFPRIPQRKRMPQSPSCPVLTGLSVSLPHLRFRTDFFSSTVLLSYA